MTRRMVLTIACLTTLIGAAPLSDARANSPFNVTDLPASVLVGCPETVNANGFDANDDTPAFKCAIAALPSTGGEIYIPAGTYYLLETLVVNGKSVAFRGAGQGITRLIWNASTAPGHHGIAFVSTAQLAVSWHPSLVNDTLTVRSLSILRAANPAGADSGAGISAAWDHPTWHGAYGVVSTVIHDVHIAPAPNNGGNWGFGIQLLNATTAKISDFAIHGLAWNQGFAGIQIGGTDLGDNNPETFGKTIGVQICDGTITKFVRGVESLHKAEGLHVQNVVIRETNWGIELKMAGQGTSIANSAILSRETGILAINVLQHAINNNTIRRFQEGPFTGIDIQWVLDFQLPPPYEPTVGEFRIIGNSIFSPPSGTPGDGIVAGAGKVFDTIIQGNTTSNMDTAISLGPATSANTVMANVNWNAVTSVFNQPPGLINYVIRNLPPP